MPHHNGFVMGIYRQLAAVALYFRFLRKNARMLAMELPGPKTAFRPSFWSFFTSSSGMTPRAALFYSCAQIHWVSGKRSEKDSGRVRPDSGWMMTE